MTEFTYDETKDKIAKAYGMLAIKMRGDLNPSAGNAAFYNGILFGMLDIAFGRSYSMNQQYIKDHYESEDRLAVARLFYRNTTDDEVKLYLRMKWGDSDWL